ncbi:MAG: hypothetical protein RLZZ623_3738 [Actinomycetota bacterium]|jgi:peptide/nickel transport system substrate-binding protein
MTRRTWGAAFVALLIIAGCGGSDSNGAASPSNSGTPAKGGTLTIGRSESFDGWVMDSAAAYATYQTHAAVFEPLLRFSADGATVEPGLAEKWTYDDATYTWTFNLRANAKFSNGQPVTSADVVFSYGIWSAGINFGGSFAQIKQVVPVDDHTVAFVMNAPDAVLPSLLSGSVAGILPADFAGMTADAFYAKPIGAGPYMVKEWASGGRIVLDRNPNYYDANRPYFDEVVIEVVPDDTELATLFESGQIDIVNYVSIATAGQYDKAKLVVTPPSQVSHVSLNATRAPFDDLHVRTAVSSAIEYNSIVNGPLAGYGTAPTGMLAPNIGNWAAPTAPYYTTDLTAAAAEMAASAHPTGFSTELIFDAANGTDALLAQILKDNLAKIGIDVKLTGLETLAFLDRAFTLDADMVLWSYGAISPDISDPLGWIGGTSYLFTGYDQTAFDAQRTAYLTTVSATEKHDAVVAIQDEAFQQAAVIALAETPTVHAVASDLTGFAPAPWGLYYFDTIRKG